MSLTAAFERGERDSVWRTLASVGSPDVDVTDATSVLVAAFTIVRVDLEAVIEQLSASGFQFRSDPVRSVEPTEIDRLNSELGRPVPVALEAFWRVVGSVNLSGTFPGVRPSLYKTREVARDEVVLADPLWVDGPTEVQRVARLIRRHHPGPVEEITICPDHVTKAGFGGGNLPSIDLALDKIDPLVLYMPYGPETFCGMVRHSMVWAGFPGFSHEARPPEWLRDLIAMVRPL